MLSRRSFGRLMTAALAARVALPGVSVGQATGGSAVVRPQFSVMIWVLKKIGSFEENLERVAKAGYGHVELVGEFAQWSAEDWTRIMSHMQALKITVDATAG